MRILSNEVSTENKFLTDVALFALKRIGHFTWLSESVWLEKNLFTCKKLMQVFYHEHDRKSHFESNSEFTSIFRKYFGRIKLSIVNQMTRRILISNSRFKLFLSNNMLKRPFFIIIFQASLSKNPFTTSNRKSTRWTILPSTDFTSLLSLVV